MVRRLVFSAALLLGLLAVAPLPASAASCTFTTKGGTMRLDGNCVTSVSISIPDGMTLDGANHTITAVDPAGDHFIGGVVQNGGPTASVRNLTIVGNFATDACDGGDNRLRGILFNGASGTISQNTVIGINQGATSGCQEGNGIEVRNAPFDGTHPATKTVSIDHNTVLAYQKTGIVSNGDVSVSIDHNTVSASAINPHNIAANSIQLAFGASGSVDHNKISGNQWCGTQNDAATAILIDDTSPGAVVSHNDIDGNSDVGIYINGDHVTVDHNNVSDTGTDCNANGYDIGIGNYGSDLTSGDPTTNDVNHNTVSGFDTPYDQVDGKNNKVKKVHPNT